MILLSVKVVKVIEVVRRGLMLLSIKVVRVMEVVWRGLGKLRGKLVGKVRKQYLMRLKVKALDSSFEAKVPEEVDCEGLNDSVGKEEDGNETEYFYSDDHRSILGSEDDNSDVCRRRNRFPTYNPNSASPHFYIEMLFNDGKQFKSVICKYLVCCKRELKIIRNEPNRVRVKCIASQKCK
ncbi:hypothetical protein J1N35_022430 [Gossypium stocksii]|uniref:Transposase MuDR plant domain-containing protein n=1 Tax=Gossypium stocksii TaxID=47602 RepID=A0A9D3VII6_9ROSI|nr:hypothetical protein J1N35_022430 [Gossypium stocksii]